jgi:hypothetical protein
MTSFLLGRASDRVPQKRLKSMMASQARVVLMPIQSRERADSPALSVWLPGWRRRGLAFARR